MSELNSTLEFLESAAEIKTPPTDSIPESHLTDTIKKTNDLSTEHQYFDIQAFGQELYHISEEKNKKRAERPNQNITGYDIAHNCIQQVLFKLRNTPIENYADSWLPIFMRTEVGSAVHNFIQNNTKQFTETEVNLKVPSIGFYGKIDYMVGSNVLGEIKTCTYEDYKMVLRKQQPREKDFLQAYTYRYMLQNHLDEILSNDVKIHYNMGEKPKLSEYNVDKLQFLYIAHDIISSQAETYAEMLECVKSVKKSLDSRHNPFFFITTIIVDLDDETCKKMDEFVSGKFEDIHYYMKTETNPDDSSRYVNKKNCYFCPYKSVCKLDHK